MSGPESDLAQEWLERARSDWILGQAALRTPGVFREDACFHAQQCAEKALKALLLKLGIAFPRTHAIEFLLDLLKTHGVEIPPDVDQGHELSQYAVQTRYPGEWEPVPPPEADRALELAGQLLAWVEKKITGEAGSA